VRLHNYSGGAVDRGAASVLVEAHVAGIDRETDLALLKISGGGAHLELGDSSRVRQGQIVLAMGNPRGLENSVTMGVVSATNRQIHPDAVQAFIQTDAPINPGNSGGPLLNTHGEVVGVNTFILTESGGSEGLGFAIPSSLVRDVYGQLKKYGRVKRRELGVVARFVTPTIAKALNLSREDGVLIQDVDSGGGAAEAGIQRDDIVTGVNGRTVRNVRQFSNSLFRSEIGERLTVELVRGDQKLEVQARLEESRDETEALAEQLKDSSFAIPRLGVLAVPLDDTTEALIPEPRYKFGSIVAAKLQVSASFQEELEPGDIIFGINGRRADGIEPLKKMLSNLPEEDPIVVQVQRERIVRYLVLRGD